jgi:hypothetical protein
MAKKKGFLIFYDALENLKTLGNDVAMEVICAMAKYDQDEDTGKLSPVAQFAFNSYVPYLDKSKKRWEANVNNGSKGGRASQDEPNGTQDEPNGTKNKNKTKKENKTKKKNAGENGLILP